MSVRRTPLGHNLACTAYTRQVSRADEGRPRRGSPRPLVPRARPGGGRDARRPGGRRLAQHAAARAASSTWCRWRSTSTSRTRRNCSTACSTSSSARSIPPAPTPTGRPRSASGSSRRAGRSFGTRGPRA